MNFLTKRRLLAVSVALALLFSAFVPDYMADDGIVLRFVEGSTAFSVNSEERPLAHAPFFNEQGFMMVPLYEIVRAIGGTINFNPGYGIVEVSISGNTLTFSTDEELSGVAIPIIKNERVFVPTRFMLDAFNAPATFIPVNQYDMATFYFNFSIPVTINVPADTSPETANEIVLRFVEGSTTFSVNGVNRQLLHVPFFQEQGSITFMMVPLNDIITAIGGTVSFNAETGSVTISVSGATMEFSISAELPFDGGMPANVNGQVFVPMRFITSAFDVTSRIPPSEPGTMTFYWYFNIPVTLIKPTPTPPHTPSPTPRPPTTGGGTNESAPEASDPWDSEPRPRTPRAPRTPRTPRTAATPAIETPAVPLREFTLIEGAQAIDLPGWKVTEPSGIPVGLVFMPKTASDIADGTFTISINGLPEGMYVPPYIDIQNGEFELELLITNLVQAGLFTLSVNIYDDYGNILYTTEAFELNINAQPAPAPQDTVFDQQAEQLPPVALRMVIGEGSFTLNGQTAEHYLVPFIDEYTNRTMVPIRFIAEALDAQVNWISETRTVTILAQGRFISLRLDEELPNGMGIPMIRNDRTFLPVAFVASELGASVNWDPEARAVYINR